MSQNFVALKSGSPKKPVKSRLAEVSPDATLETRCLAVVVAHLENYPAEAMGILSVDAWEAIIKARHERTAPKKGKGGLDGSGRMHPAISERYMSAVEEANPHLSDCELTDRLVWKDCVQYSFPHNNTLVRPRELRLPWPMLVDKIQRAGNDLLEILGSSEVDGKSKLTVEKSVHTLCDAPMNLALLEQTKIGKVVQKILKLTGKRKETVAALGMSTDREIKFPTVSEKTGQMISQITQLNNVLHRWKNVANESGCVMMNSRQRNSGVALDEDMAADLKVAETCGSWRTLFAALHLRESTRRANQSAKMRERREEQKKIRPGIQRVKTANYGPAMRKKSSAPAQYWRPGQNKMELLRSETKVASSMQRSNPKKRKQLGFGNAVAFASTGKCAKKEPPAMKMKTTSLAGGKRITVPMQLPANAKPSLLKQKLMKRKRR